MDSAYFAWTTCQARIRPSTTEQGAWVVEYDIRNVLLDAFEGNAVYTVVIFDNDEDLEMHEIVRYRPNAWPALAGGKTLSMSDVALMSEDAVGLYKEEISKTLPVLIWYWPYGEQDGNPFGNLRPVPLRGGGTPVEYTFDTGDNLHAPSSAGFHRYRIKFQVPISVTEKREVCGEGSDTFYGDPPTQIQLSGKGSWIPNALSNADQSDFYPNVEWDLRCGD